MYAQISVLAKLTWSDDSDTTALFIHFRFLPGKHRKSCITQWERVWKPAPDWKSKLGAKCWREFYGLQVFALPQSLTLPLAQLRMHCLFFTSEKLQWSLSSSSTSRSQCRVVFLYICPVCFQNASKHSLHPNLSTGVSGNWWGNSCKMAGQCKAIAASAGQKSSSRCSEFS